MSLIPESNVTDITCINPCIFYAVFIDDTNRAQERLCLQMYKCLTGIETFPQDLYNRYKSLPEGILWKMRNIKTVSGKKGSSPLAICIHTLRMFDNSFILFSYNQCIYKNLAWISKMQLNLKVYINIRSLNFLMNT